MRGNAPVQQTVTEAGDTAAKCSFLTAFIDDQMFGLPLLAVQEVLERPAVTPIQLAPPEVAGAINLRGRIITAIDVRKRLYRQPRDAAGRAVGIVVEHDDEIFNLLFDAVGDVMTLGADRRQDNPPTFDPVWCTCSDGIYRLDARLMVIVNIPALLEIEAAC
jgi:purine-binding chemotaxis protein CheW